MTVSLTFGDCSAAPLNLLGEFGLSNSAPRAKIDVKVELGSAAALGCHSKWISPQSICALPCDVVMYGETRILPHIAAIQ